MYRRYCSEISFVKSRENVPTFLQHSPLCIHQYLQYFANIHKCFFLLSDDSVSIIGGGTPRPAQPLPREEPLEDPEEKARLISQVLELQNTLDGMSLFSEGSKKC